MEVRVWSVALLALGLASAVNGCSASTSSFECSSDRDCSSDGRCEPTGFCSFPDPGCASGFRYSEFAESLSNQCVVDAGDSTGLTADSSSTSSSTGSTGSTTTPGTTGGSSESSGGSSSAGTTEGSSGSSSDSGSETTGTVSDCLLEDFDALPGLPIWFAFSDSPTPVGVDAGQLVLAVQSDEGPALAGLRTNIPADFSQGSARAILTEVPELSVATTSFSVNDEVFGESVGWTFGVRDGMISLDRRSDMGPILLASEPVGPMGFPVEFAFVVAADSISFVVTRNGVADEFHTEDVPDWLDDAYISLDAGNPSTNATDGVTRFDLVEVCADGLR